MGLESSLDVNAADEEVVWVDAPWGTSSLRQQGITLIIKEFFGHVFACKKVEWAVTNTGAPSSAGMRELELEFAAGTSSARLRKAHGRVQEFLKKISFDESGTGKQDRQPGGRNC